MLFFFFNHTLYTQSNSLKAPEYYQQAEAFLLKGKPEKAIKFFRKAITANEQLTAAWRAMGATYDLLENYDSTIAHYHKTIELNPNFSRVLYFELGRAYYRNGQYQNALTYFDQFEKLQAKGLHIFGLNGEKEIQTVYFDFNDFGLNPAATKIVDKLLTTFDSTSFNKVEVVGFADTSGVKEYNLVLSKKRAANVAKYLKINSIISEELIILGRGENSQYDKKQLNRRVEIRFL